MKFVKEKKVRKLNFHSKECKKFTANNSIFKLPVCGAWATTTAEYHRTKRWISNYNEPTFEFNLHLFPVYVPSATDIVSKCLFEEETRRNAGNEDKGAVTWRNTIGEASQYARARAWWIAAVWPYSRPFYQVRNSREGERERKDIPRGSYCIARHLFSSWKLSSAPLLTWFHPASNVERPTCQTERNSNLPDPRIDRSPFVLMVLISQRLRSLKDSPVIDGFAKNPGVSVLRREL